MSDYISDNNLIQILKHLPMRSLVRFRSVCKCWKELVDSQEFMEVHLAVQKPRFIVNFKKELDFVFVDLCNPPLLQTLASPIRGQKLSIVSTLHGVVCLYGDGQDFLFWNSSIRKSSTIPLPLSFNCGIRKEQWRCRGFGFWVDPSTKEFKIIMLMYDMRTVILYSSIRHDWTVVPPEGLDRYTFPNDVAAVVIGGVAYWIDGLVQGITCFDFRQESFEFIDVPNIQINPPCSFRPIQWKGTLAILGWHASFPHRCEIYGRQEGSWISIFRFNLAASETADLNVMVMKGVIEDRIWALIGIKPDFTTRKAPGLSQYDMGLYDSRVGCIPLMNDVRYVTACDFVESLLFP